MTADNLLALVGGGGLFFGFCLGFFIGNTVSD
jgi:hypothetical protein